MTRLRRWRVASGLLEVESRLLLVENIRRNGSTDWSTPGGVVEVGEQPVAGLTREVREETGIDVHRWIGPTYRVSTIAPDMGWHLDVEVHLAKDWSGSLKLGDDPDGIVIGAEYCDRNSIAQRVASTALWVREPLLAWFDERFESAKTFRYEVTGADRATAVVTRLE